MSAPRLLPKKQINAEVATQQKQRIIEGITLAKKVDKVRETLGEEEARLEKFRTESIAQVQRDIDAKIREREGLEQENKRKREERFALEAPIDLKEEWQRVNEEKAQNEQWNSRLINEQVGLLARESDCEELEFSLSKRNVELKEKEQLTERTLIEAETKFEDASKTLDSAKKESQATIKRVYDKEKDVLIREQEVQIWDNDLRKLESELKEKEVDLAGRERALTYKYQMFIKAQNYINSKNNK